MQRILGAILVQVIGERKRELESKRRALKMLSAVAVASRLESS